MSSLIKQTSIVIICLLMVNIAVALDEFEVTLIAYNPETQSAQIGIKNIGSKDYHDLTMAIDNLEPVRIVGLLRQGNTIKIPKGLPPGKHTITVSTEEGVTVKKELDFPKSQTQIKAELEKKQMVKELTGEPEEKRVAERVYETKKPIVSSIVIIILMLALFLLLLYFIFKKKKKII